MTMKRLLLATILAGVSVLGTLPANAFWGWSPFGWGGPWGGGPWDGPWGGGPWGSPWYGPYGGYPYGFTGVPYGWGAPVYGYPGYAYPGYAYPYPATSAQPSPTVSK
ncbi:sulfur globule protein CV3 [Thiocystis violacea]|uniref:sulfur globule protein CV3 n=1 Tax=Thiocystis violacea TaxID=13725 RepID=UPI0019033463|nr:sulfur globule protein CV3 [Thiocystis violacea]MBK1717713.1 sulfur globule protein CV3 [Thiocystis violacea]